MKDNELQKNTPNLAQNSPFPGSDAEKGKATDDPKSSISQAQTTPEPSKIEVLCQTLDKLPANTKVKVKILDFESYREFLPFVNKYSAKFEVFKYATEFEVVSENTQKGVQTEIATFKESLNEYLKKSKIDPKITEILQKEIE
jgi:hypothetical protein